jgi:hypothetical protein
MLRSFLLMLVVAMIAVAAPLPKATFKKLKDYYPLAKGHTWTYESGTTEIVVKVTECEVDKQGNKTAVLTTFYMEKEVATETIRTGKDGIFRTKINENTIDPPVQLLKFDKEDAEWEIKSKILTSEIVTTVKHLGEEKLEVPAGSYTAVRIHIQGEVSKTKTEVTYWLIEDVGIGQLEFRIGGNDSPAMKLKSFKPGKE